jgi:hypothetical protein
MTAFLAFSKANSQIDCILQKWLSLHKNNYFITQILPEKVKILILILPDFCLSPTVGGWFTRHPSPGRYVPVDTLTLTVKQTIRNL